MVLSAPATPSVPATPWLAAAALVSNALVWGLSWIAFRALQATGVHPLWATAMVFTVAMLGILAWRPKAGRSFAAHPGLWVLFMASGLSNVGFNWAVTVGDVVRVALLFYTMPAWAVLLAWLVLGERPTRSRLLQVALALAGVAIVLKQPGVPWPVPSSLPDYLALLGGLSFALTNIMLRKLRHVPTAACMLAMFSGGAGTATGVALAAMGGGLVQGVPFANMAWVAWVGWAAALSLGFIGGNLALQYGVARLSAVTGSLIMLSEVLFASVSSVLMGVSSANTHTLAGGTMILLAALLASRSENKGL